MDAKILHLNDVCLHKDSHPLGFDSGPGLTLLTAGRECAASTLSMAIAGRFSPSSGTIRVGRAETTRQRFLTVALAGIPMIDSLERSVHVREIVREQVAWAQPFFRRVPRDILSHELVTPWLEPLGLGSLEASTSVGALHPLDRIRLRTLLALISRPQAALLVVDDPDQLRNTQLREQFLGNLKALSEKLPVLVTTVNLDVTKVADQIIGLSTGVAS